MTDSKSTDKLISMTFIIDKIIDKLPAEKLEKIKNLEIVWKTSESIGYRIDHPLPELKLEFYK